MSLETDKCLELTFFRKSLSTIVKYINKEHQLSINIYLRDTSQPRYEIGLSGLTGQLENVTDIASLLAKVIPFMAY